VTKERRLGRGLEALLGQLPVRNEAAAPTSHSPPATDVPPAHANQPSSRQAALSAETLFRLDVPHAGAAQAAAHPHRPPSASPIAPPQEPSAQPQAAEPKTDDNPNADRPVPLNTVLRVDVRHIDRNPNQPRQEFNSDEMRSLTESIATHGLLQPVVVRRVNDRYQLVAGERRLRAAVEAGWENVPVHVVEADDRQMAELAIVENLQRKDLNALEKAASFQKYLDQYHCTQEELAGRLKLDRSTIANLIRLLELPEPVQEALRRGKITPGHARALLPLGDEPEQVEFCRRIQQESLNVRQIEELVQDAIAAADHDPITAAESSPAKKTLRSSRGKSEHTIALEQEFRAALGLKVQISHNARGRGKMVVHFRNHDEFERLKQHICGN